MDFLTYADGTLDLIDIANKIEMPIWDVYPIVDDLSFHGVIKCNKENYGRA